MYGICKLKIFIRHSHGVDPRYSGACAHPPRSGWRPLHGVTTTQGALLPQPIRCPRKENYKSQYAPRRPVRRRKAAPQNSSRAGGSLSPWRARPLRKSRTGAGGPSAPAAMALVATVAALLAALGGALWLAARRFVGPSVRHGGGDSGLMHGKTVLITGANSGLGRATAAELLRLGARVIMGCRDRARAEEAAGQLRRELRQAGGPGPGSDAGEAGELVVRELDLASLRSVRAFCQEMLQVWGSGSQLEIGDGRRPRRAGGAWAERRVAAQSPGGVTLGKTKPKSPNSPVVLRRLGSAGWENW